MSFRCQGCGLAQPTGTPPIRTVTKVRTTATDRGPIEEIAQEKNFCTPCAEPYEKATSQKLEHEQTKTFQESLEALESRVGRA